MDFKRRFILFLFGGSVYYIMEILFSGSSHWTMFITGGICFLLIGWMRRKLYQKNMFLLCLIGSGIITTVEFVVGILVNKVFMMGVWDYSHLPLDIMGQICPYFTLIWIVVSWIAIHADRLFCKLMFGTELPQKIYNIS